MISEHSMPRYAGEEIPDGFPSWTDARMQPWLDTLHELGVIDEQGIMQTAANVTKSIHIAPNDIKWIIRVEWQYLAKIAK